MDDWMNDDEPFFDFGPVNDPFGEMIFDFSDGLDDDDLATMVDESLIASDPTAVPTTSKLHTLRYGLARLSSVL